MYDVVLFSDTNGSIGWGRDAGAYTIASQLRKNGYRVKTIDFFSFFDFNRFKNVIDTYVSKKTLFLGFSCTHMTSVLPQNLEDYYMNYQTKYKDNIVNVYLPFPPDTVTEWFAYVKELYPNIKTVVGGLKVAHKIQLQKKYPFIDLWVGGLADSSIVYVANSLKNNIDIPKKLIKSEIEHPYPEEEFCNTSIQWHKTDDTIFEGEALPMEISRGCPFKCTFCDFPKRGKNTWIKNEDAIRNELLFNYENFGTTKYMISDSQINESIDKMRMVHKVFTSMPFKVEWTGFCRLELLNTYPEMVDLIYESGCKSVMWGIETINPNTGKIIGKNTNLKQIEYLLDLCKKRWGNEIITGSGFVFGLPNETAETIKDLTNWLTVQPYLDSWVISALYIGDYDPKKSYAKSFSKIQLDPKKYGYSTEKSPDKWSYDNISRDSMLNTVEEFYHESRHLRSIVAKHCYMRCLNLGFSHEELLKANLGNEEWVHEAINRYRYLAKVYFKRNKI